jgi:Transketolase, thiamine diphosphate binding domain
MEAPGRRIEQNRASDQLCINTIRTLAMDAVQQASSGHPGTPMALAPLVYTLWQSFLRFDPDDTTWPNRDRFETTTGPLGQGCRNSVAEVWRRGSVISSWLLDLAAAALAKDPQLKGFSGFVQDSGEGRWTIEAAIEEAVPADVLAAALFARFRSRQEHTFGEKMLSAMRFGFGGHIEGKEPIAPPSKPKESQGRSATPHAAE